MVYPYKVKVNGKYYLPNENVPTELEVVDEKPQPSSIDTEETIDTEDKPKKKGGRPSKAEV